MDVTPKKRSKILTLSEHTSKTQRDIAKTCGVNQSTVSRILKLFWTNGSITPYRKGCCGRKRITTPRDDKYILQESKIKPRKTSFDLSRDLAQQE